jgi:hypothetical protein
LIFTVEQVRAVREGKTNAALVVVSERIRVGSLRLLRRRIPASEDGVRPERVEVVTDRTPDGEEVAVYFTVLVVRDVEVTALGFPEARACGHRTPAGLRDRWRAQHPRAELARFVRFALGDLRDSPRFISRGWPDYTSDPSRAMFGEPEPVSNHEHRLIAAEARQRYLRHKADLARDAAAFTLGERLAAIKRATSG